MNNKLIKFLSVFVASFPKGSSVRLSPLTIGIFTVTVNDSRPGIPILQSVIRLNE